MISKESTEKELFQDRYHLSPADDHHSDSRDDASRFLTRKVMQVMTANVCLEMLERFLIQYSYSSS